jgi:hypothetical protein
MMKGALTLVTSLLLAACAITGPGPDRRLVGTWRYADKTQSCRYSFSPDGSFTGDVKRGAKTISSFTGQWTVQGNSLLYKYRSDSFGRIPAGADDRDTLLEVGNNSFLIEAANGERRRYLRVR